MSLTNDQIRQYEQEGYVFPIDVLTASEVAA